MTTVEHVHSLRARIRSTPEELWPLATLTVAYYLGAQGAFAIGTLSDKIVAPFWPPNVVLFCALMLVPVGRWWLYILAAFPAHVLAELGIGMAPPQLLISFAANCLVAATNAFAIRKLAKAPPWFGDLRKTSAFIAVTAFASPALCALLGAFGPILGGGAPAEYATYWVHWYAANALGGIALGPIALIAVSEDFRRHFSAPWQRHFEAGIIVLVLMIVSNIVFDAAAGRPDSATVAVLVYVPLPLILWATVRFGARGASAAILAVTTVLIWRTLDGSSLLATGDREANVLALQAFLIAMGIPVLLLGSAIDATREAERTTRESEERMAFAAGSANVGLWHSIPNGEFWASEPCRTIFGLAPNIPITRDALLRTVHPDYLPMVTESFRMAVLDGEPFAIEVRITAGDDRWILASGRAHYDDAIAPVQISGAFIDISARKAAEAESELQRRELAHLTRVATLGELSGTIAHELNQPLTAILSNAQAAQHMAAGGRSSTAELAEVLEDIAQEANRAGEVIHRLRRLLKKGDGEIEPIELGDCVRSTVRLLHSELVHRKVRIKIQLTEGLPALAGDPVQIQQVILNLLLNAIEALSQVTPDRRVITVRSRQVDDTVELSIADRGTGISPESRQSMFQPFYSTKPHGLGLGLPICSTIIKSHGGDLDVVNNGDGGATAVIRLPIISTPKTEAHDAGDPGSKPPELLSVHR